MRNRFRCLGESLALAIALAAPLNALPAPKTDALDQKGLHAAYNEGDFEKVVGLIEAFTKANTTYVRADSITIAKHLAVVYSANPKTREKGRYYMYRLLEMMPSAELVDMFVSDEIDRIFEKVRREFMVRQKGVGVDSARISLPENRSPEPGPGAQAATAAGSGPIEYASPAGGPSREYMKAASAEESFWKRNGFWIAGGVGLAVAGTAVLYIYAAQDEPQGRTYVIGAEAMAGR